MSKGRETLERQRAGGTILRPSLRLQDPVVLAAQRQRVSAPSSAVSSACGLAHRRQQDVQHPHPCGQVEQVD